MKLLTKQKEAHRLKKRTYGCWGEGIVREFRMVMCRVQFSSVVQFSLVTQLCPNICDRMNCSMPGLPVHHQLLEFTQTHVRQVGDAIQPLEENCYVIPYPISRYIVKGNEIIVSKRDLYSHVHCSIIHSRLGIGTT